MALNNEDKADVRKHMGKALANKVSKVTRDSNYKGEDPDKMGARITMKHSRSQIAIRKAQNTLRGNSPYEKKAKSYEDDWAKADRAEMRRRKRES